MCNIMPVTNEQRHYIAHTHFREWGPRRPNANANANANANTTSNANTTANANANTTSNAT